MSCVHESYEDGNVIIRSLDGMDFKIDSDRLKASSAAFAGMLDVVGDGPLDDHIITLDERCSTIKVVLDLVTGNNASAIVPPELGLDMWLMVDIAQFLVKWDFNAQLQHFRAVLLAYSYSESYQPKLPVFVAGAILDNLDICVAAIRHAQGTYANPKFAFGHKISLDSLKDARQPIPSNGDFDFTCLSLTGMSDIPPLYAHAFGRAVSLVERDNRQPTWADIASKFKKVMQSSKEE